MTNTTNSCDLTKAVVLTCAMSLAAANGVAVVEAQTVANVPYEACAPESMSNESGQAEQEVVVEISAIEQAQKERTGRSCQKFQQLAQQWKQDRGSMSSITEMSMLPSYQKIMGMGVTALPLIIAELKAEGDDPDQWFWALGSIAEANELNPPQIRTEDQGNYRRMAQAWVEWAEAEGYAG